MSEKYLIGNWVSFVQQIQHLVSRGYGEFCLIKYPEKKAEKFLKIDRKLIDKYDANLNKDKSYYNKKRKLCNFKFLRWNDVGIILKTKGDVKDGIIVDDVFLSVKKKKIQVHVGETMTLNIGYDGKGAVTVFIDNESFKIVKATAASYIDSSEYNKAINTFNNLNGLPSWGGIVSQKIKMKDHLVKKMKKQLPQEKVYVFSKKMIINTKRTAVKVF
ncbi:hypothetical protein ACIQXQ_20715 [Peribacillus sp. NPDC097198]|uniref:hypothetical protein n=1 Tax=Peribacillus sp. NPDC097198 TaxID=3364397 RepID=UPI003812E799